MIYSDTMLNVQSRQRFPAILKERRVTSGRKPRIPIHDFSRDDSTSIPFKLLRLENKTDYDPSEPHRHNYYEVFYFEEGDGQHMVDFEWLPIQPHSLHLVSPGQVHCVQRSLDSSGYVLLFSRDFLLSTAISKDDVLGLPLFLHPRAVSVVLPQEQAAAIRTVIDSMKREWVVGGAFSEDIVRAYLTIMLLKYASLVQPMEEEHRADSVTIQLVQRFKVAVENNFRHLHQVCDYAAHLAVTPSHLNDVTKKVTGSNASDVIHERIVLEAKRLLLHSGLTTKEIASFLNFQDPSYFSRFFRKYTGQSPSGFKAALAQHYGG